MTEKFKLYDIPNIVLFDSKLVRQVKKLQRKMKDDPSHFIHRIVDRIPKEQREILLKKVGDYGSGRPGELHSLTPFGFGTHFFLLKK